ncbi:MAG: hypothetical protein V8T87_02570 [Victivallales bacterium]
MDGTFLRELKRRQHAIDNSYHCIFKGNSAYARKIREAYWRTVQELFIESFFQPVNDWCKANGLKLCGHGIGEEDPLAATNGMNIFALQTYVGIPGFDPHYAEYPRRACLQVAESRRQAGFFGGGTERRAPGAKRMFRLQSV